MTLTPADKTNPLLAKLVEGWTADLAILRARNDGPMSSDDTLTLRGRIATLKACIALADDDITIAQ